MTKYDSPERALALDRHFLCKKHKTEFVLDKPLQIKRCPSCLAEAKAKVRIEKERYYRVNRSAENFPRWRSQQKKPDDIP